MKKKEDSLSGKIKVFRGIDTEWDLVLVKDLKKSLKDLGKRLFANPEPCCHGVRKLNAFKIMGDVFGKELL